jgi:Ca-activated chloride channel family protein
MPRTSALVLSLLLLPVAFQQTPQQPTFRAGTRTVAVYASVTDEAGGFLLDLTRDDFELRDDGQLQPLTQFATTVEPLSAIVLLDGSRSMVNALNTVIAAADHFVIRLMPGDEARVGSFSDEVRMENAFTSNRDELARQVNDLFDLRIGTSTRLWDAVSEAVGSFQEEHTDRRKVVIVFTDGDDTWSTTSFDDAIGRARRADVMIYAVLIRGGVQRPPEDRLYRRPPPDFSRLAAVTGGGYYPVDNPLDDLNSISTEIAEELHNQYVLGFVPQQLDGKLHKLDVRVKRPHTRVRARQSYVAEPDRAPAPRTSGGSA